MPKRPEPVRERPIRNEQFISEAINNERQNIFANMNSILVFLIENFQRAVEQGHLSLRNDQPDAHERPPFGKRRELQSDPFSVLLFVVCFLFCFFLLGTDVYLYIS